MRVICWGFGAQILIQDLQSLYKNNQQSGFSLVAEYLYRLSQVWRWRPEGLKLKVILWLHRVGEVWSVWEPTEEQITKPQRSKWQINQSCVTEPFLEVDMLYLAHYITYHWATSLSILFICLFKDRGPPNENKIKTEAY